MKRHTAFLAYIFFALTFTLTACKKDEVEPVGANDKNNLTLEFDNRAGAQKLALATTSYKNGSGEEFTVTTFNYFISNVALKKSDGTIVKFPNQYFLIRQADEKTLTPVLKDVPAGDYKEITFLIGVDSTKSVSNIAERTGVLDETSYGTDNMYWAWNSGYIFLKFEGTSPVAPANSAGVKAFQLHIGGFGGRTAVTPNNLRTVTLSLPQQATVRKSIAPTIHLVSDITRVFDGVNKISLSATNMVHNPKDASPIADNYKSMFIVDHVHND